MPARVARVGQAAWLYDGSEPKPDTRKRGKRPSKVHDDFRVALSYAHCIDCRRRLTLMSQRLNEAHLALPKEDFCKWCARPCSQRAKRLEESFACEKAATNFLEECGIAPQGTGSE
jgi:hypothetical protein